jgi:aspartate ammonia-lyase
VPYRTENDVLGKVKIESTAYYGSETQRASENFRISGIRIQSTFIKKYLVLKRSAALANLQCGNLDKKRANAIAMSCDLILSGRLMEQFVVDVFQAGAGTSVNMNVNEVIANCAIEMLGGRKGNYGIIHPNDHVNMSQSTNDTFHTVTRMSANNEVKKSLIPSLQKLSSLLGKKSKELVDTVKIGRTHLQDAVPMTFGQEFSGYAESVNYCIKELASARKALMEVPLGGTAIGTGINSSKCYASSAIKEINRFEHERYKAAKNRFAAMQNEYAELICSNALKDTAITLNKIANDFRLLASGPSAGLAELSLPAVQPGSSIMPGKINPSMAEMLNMVCFQVLGNSTVVDRAADSGQLELNVFMPVIAFNLLFSIEILSNAVSVFADKCVKGIKIDRERARYFAETSAELATALSPYIGYAKAADIVREAAAKKRSIIDVCLKRKIMDEKELKRILDPKKLAKGV